MPTVPLRPLSLRLILGVPLAVAALLVSSPRSAWTEEAHGPKVAFDREEHDFGVVAQEQELPTSFTLRNEGDEPLKDLKAVADCGCYGTTLSATELAPGASAVLKVSFRTLMLVGPVQKRLSVHSNDPKRPMVVLRLRLLVGAGVVVDPGRVYFGDVLTGSTPSGSVFAKWLEGVGKPFKVIAVEVPGHPDDVLVSKEEQQDRQTLGHDKDGKPIEGTWKGTKVTFAFTKPPPIGMFSATALLRTDHPDYPRIAIPLTVNVSGRVYIPYRKIMFGYLKPGQTKQSTLVIRPFSPDVKLGTVTANARGKKVQVEIAPEPKAAPGSWKLVVTVPADAPPGKIDDVIELHTEVPGEETSELTVVGEVLPGPR